MGSGDFGYQVNASVSVVLLMPFLEFWGGHCCWGPLPKGVRLVCNNVQVQARSGWLLSKSRSTWTQQSIWVILMVWVTGVFAFLMRIRWEDSEIHHSQIFPTRFLIFVLQYNNSSMLTMQILEQYWSSHLYLSQKANEQISKMFKCSYMKKENLKWRECSLKLKE